MGKILHWLQEHIKYWIKPATLGYFWELVCK